MDLSQYMKKHNIRNNQMAESLGFTSSFISKLRKKKATPSLINAILISRYCEFKVSILDLIHQEAIDSHLLKRGMIPIVKIEEIRRGFFQV